MSQPKSETPNALLELLDAPIAFHRAFVKIGGGVTAGLLLSQAFYWSKNRRAKERGGWFYKSHAAWEEETGLTRREQKTAREHLTEKGLLEEKIDALPGKGRVLWYRVNLDRLYDALKALIEPLDSAPGTPEPSDENEQAGSSQSDGGVAQKRQTPVHETALPIAQKRQTPHIYAETTAETTTKTTHTHLRAAGAPAVVVCDGSKFSPEDCRRYADHLHASGQGVTNPGGFARSIHKTGSEDAQIALWFAEIDPERGSSGELPPPTEIDASACPDCLGRGLYYPDPQNPSKGVKRCQHPRLAKVA